MEIGIIERTDRMKIADKEFIDAVTGKVRKVGELFEEISELKKKLNDAEDKLNTIKDFMNYEFSGNNEWVKERVLQIIEDN